VINGDRTDTTQLKQQNSQRYYYLCSTLP